MVDRNRQDFFGPLPPSDFNRDRDVQWLETQRPDPLVPFGVLGYAEVTSDQTGISTLVDLTDLSVTVTTGGDRRIKITGFAHFKSASSEDERARLRIRNASDSTLNYANSGYMVEQAEDKGEQITVFAVVTPAAGSQTYKLSAERITGATDIEMDASSIHPAFILAEDIGPDSS